MLGIVMTDDGNVVDLGKAIEKRRGQDPGRASVRRRARARRRPADHRGRSGLGIRALAHGSARHRARGEPAQPRLAHRHRRRAVRADRARRGGPHDARHGLEPRAHLARLAHHRARPARRRRDHRRRDDGGEDGGRLGPPQGRRLLLRGDRDAAPHRRARHRRRLHADRLARNPSTGEYAGGIFWIVGAAVLVLVDRFRHHHAVPRGQDAAGFRARTTRRRTPIPTTRRSTASFAA